MRNGVGIIYIYHINGSARVLLYAPSVARQFLS